MAEIDAKMMRIAKKTGMKWPGAVISKKRKNLNKKSKRMSCPPKSSL